MLGSSLLGRITDSIFQYLQPCSISRTDNIFAQISVFSHSKPSGRAFAKKQFNRWVGCNRTTIDQIIADSGLFGLTVYTNEAGNSVLEFYYYGKPTDTDAFRQFNQSARKAIQYAGGMLSGYKELIHRAWFYAQPDITASWGAGFTIPYTDVSGELYTQPKNRPNAVVSAVAQSLNPTSRGFDQKNITKKQFAKQRAIAEDYDQAPLYDLDNPIVQRAYEELAAEVKAQYLAMPLRGVELLSGQGEPYANLLHRLPAPNTPQSSLSEYGGNKRHRWCNSQTVSGRDFFAKSSGRLKAHQDTPDVPLFKKTAKNTKIKNKNIKKYR